MRTESGELEAAEHRLIEAIGALMELWGFKAIMGRLWTVLYLSPEPLSAAELRDRLALSSGAVSMALGELQKWGVVKKAWRPGERRDYFEPETSVWKMVTRVWRERELGHVREVIETFREVLAACAAGRRTLGSSASLAKKVSPKLVDERQRLKFVEQRVRSLLAFAEVGRRLLEVVVATDAPQAPPLLRLFQHSAHR